MLLPVLKRPDWPGIEAGLQAHVWLGPTEDPLVLVAYADHHDDGRCDYVSQTAAQLRGTPLLEEAFANLEGCHTTFDAIETDGQRLLLSMGPGLVTDRALLQSHMLLAHEKLEADEIVLSIPRSGILVVADRRAGRSVRHALLDAHHRGLHDEAMGSDPLFDGLVLMRDGWPVGTITAEEPWT